MVTSGNLPFEITVLDDACHLCRRCLADQACRGGAFLTFGGDESPFVDMARCRGCLVCLPACPFGAVVKRTDRSQPHLQPDA